MNEWNNYFLVWVNWQFVPLSESDRAHWCFSFFSFVVVVLMFICNPKNTQWRDQHNQLIIKLESPYFTALNQFSIDSVQLHNSKINPLNIHLYMRACKHSVYVYICVHAVTNSPLHSEQAKDTSNVLTSVCNFAVTMQKYIF